MMRPRTPREPGRRSAAMALLATLIVVTVGALIGTSLLYSADAARRSAAASLRTEQARLLAWSGVQAVMAELAAQRDGLIAAEPPAVTGSWVFAESEGVSVRMDRGPSGPRFAYRLVPIDGADVASESGKLDVNHAPAEILAKLPGLGEDLAGRIVAARSERAFASLHDLLRVERMTEQNLFGAAGAAGVSKSGRGGESLESEPSDALARFLTVFSFDPNIQAGLGANGAAAAGERRLNLNVQWSDELGSAVERRFGADASAALQRIMTSGGTFTRDADIVSRLRSLGVPPTDWPPILDAFTTNDAEFLLGRVDLMTAPAEVLACIPGIDEDAAARIVARRGRIEPEQRSSVAWPVIDGILTPEQFAEAVDHLTVRAMQWRVIVEAGTIIEEAVGGRGGEGLPRIGGPGGDRSLGEIPDNARLTDRVVLEAVIDVSSRRPRVAYLRDITMLPIAQALQRRSGSGESAESTLADRPSSGAESTPDASAVGPLPEAAGGGPAASTLRASRSPSSFSPVPSDTESSDLAPTPSAPPPDGRIGRWTTRSGGRP